MEKSGPIGLVPPNFVNPSSIRAPSFSMEGMLAHLPFAQREVSSVSSEPLRHNSTAREHASSTRSADVFDGGGGEYRHGSRGSGGGVGQGHNGASKKRWATRSDGRDSTRAAAAGAVGVDEDDHARRSKSWGTDARSERARTLNQRPRDSAREGNTSTSSHGRRSSHSDVSISTRGSDCAAGETHGDGDEHALDTDDRSEKGADTGCGEKGEESREAGRAAAVTAPDDSSDVADNDDDDDEAAHGSDSNKEATVPAAESSA